MLDLNALAQECHSISVSKGWWGEHTETDPDTGLMRRSSFSGGPNSFNPPAQQFINIIGEVSEAWEEWRRGRGMTDIRWEHKDGMVCVSPQPCGDDREARPEGIPVELADVIIRVLDTCGAYEIDIARIVHLKMEYNKTRPHRHGGKIA